MTASEGSRGAGCPACVRGKLGPLALAVNPERFPNSDRASVPVHPDRALDPRQLVPDALLELDELGELDGPEPELRGERQDRPAVDADRQIVGSRLVGLVEASGERGRV